MITMKRALAAAILVGACLGTSGAGHAADNDTTEVFTLRSSGPDVSQHWLKAVPHVGSPTKSHAVFVPNKADATIWFIDSAGRLSYKNGNDDWVSFTVGSSDPREIFWPVPGSQNFLVWKKHANGKVVSNDPVLDKLQSCAEVGVPDPGRTLWIGSFVDNRNDCKSVDLHSEVPL
ncbi:hypothetical protein [Streptomyces sp. NPDC002209]|uniref:hypothetical protein n=1 Tax=Streptomyces sp. NPDC002209 TaxID=3364638 RepID=UPI0036A81F77